LLRIAIETRKHPIVPDPKRKDLDQIYYHISNPRPGRIYGFSPVEWVIMTANIALRRQVETWDHRDCPLKSLESLFPRPFDRDYSS